MSNNRLEEIGIKSNDFQNNMGFFSGIILMALMFLTSADVFGRYVLLNPISGAKEIGQLMMAGLTYLGMGYAFIKGAHVQVTVLTDKAASRAKLFLGIIALVCGLIFFIIHTYGSWGVFWESIVINEAMYATVFLPWWLGKLFVFLGAAFICGQYLIHLILRRV